MAVSVIGQAPAAAGIFVQIQRGLPPDRGCGGRRAQPRTTVSRHTNKNSTSQTFAEMITRSVVVSASIRRYSMTKARIRRLVPVKSTSDMTIWNRCKGAMWG